MADFQQPNACMSILACVSAEFTLRMQHGELER